MKYFYLISAILLTTVQLLTAQVKAIAFDRLTGVYQGEIDSSEQFIIKVENNHLMIEIRGQGQTDLIPVSDNRFKLNHVKLETLVQFLKDSLDGMQRLIWIQKAPSAEWVRTQGSTKDSLSIVGDYRLKNNPYAFFKVREEGGQLRASSAAAVFALSPISNNRFIYQNGDYKLVFEFVKDGLGKYEKLITSRSGTYGFKKIPETLGGTVDINYGFHRKNGFTRADTLRGMLTPLRTCYDVLFYDLDVKVEPETKSIHGNCTIRFSALESFDKMQVDLFANMKIEKILSEGRELAYTREFNAVFIQFPEKIQKGKISEIKILYGGKPQIPDPSVLAGGFLWLQNKNGNFWIESVCQGSGASLWWPCKDHLSDKPDSMKISVTVPSSLTDISNGRLQRKTNLPGNLTRFDWYVSYPINTYDVALNIGEYVHFSDTYIALHDTLTLDYYCMPYNIERARQVFTNVKPMIALYEKDFGPFPFIRDGYSLMESLYPMEHQTAVSMGSINNPVSSDQFDPKELTRTIWHESAHEWWGNSVSCKDFADLWIHEAFATYAEVLDYASVYGKKAALNYMKAGAPANKEPIIGFYQVNDFHLGDMYSKGALMLYTLQHVVDDDSLWFSVLRGIQDHFRYQTVTTDDIVNYINEKTKKNYSNFFDQYLKYPAIPELLLILKNEGSSLDIQYKWKSDLVGFNMPVKVTTAKDSYAFIYPSTSWQDIKLQNMKPKDFKVDTDDFYIELKKEE